MKPNRLAVAGVLLAVLACSSRGSMAGPVVFSTPATISGDTDVSTAGAAIFAYDWANAGATINGVPFVGSTSTGTIGTNLTLSAPGMTSNTTAFNSGSSPFSGLSAAYRSILIGSDYSNNGAVATATLTSLTANHVYQAQFWVNDPRPVSGRNELLTSPGGNSVTLGYSVNNTGGSPGQYTIGTFLASGSSQAFTFASSSSSTPAQVNAMQLRDVTNLGYWNGTNGSTWDQNSTANFSTNLYNAPFAAGTFSQATGATQNAYFGDYYYNSGSTVAVTSGSVNVAAGGVSTGTVWFQNNAVPYTLTSSDSAGITGSTALVVQGGGLLTLAGSNSFSGATTVSSGTLQVGTGISGQDGTLGNTSGVTNNGSLVYDLLGNRTISYAISGSGNLTTAGPATLTMAGNLSYTGSTIINAGGVNINGAVINQPTVVNSGGTLTLTTASAFNGISSVYTMFVNGGDVVWNSNNANPGRIYLSGGTINMASSGVAYERYGIEADASAATSVINGPGSLQLVSDQTGSPIEFTVQAGTPTVGLLVNAPIGRVGGLTKDGPGGMVMAGSNTYSGNTTVSNGSLSIINGGAINNAGSLIVSGTNAPVFTLSGGTLISSYTSNGIDVGNAAGQTGAVNVASGLISMTGASNQNVNLGDSGNGVWNQSGGTVALAGGFWQVNQSGNTATANITGGLLTVGTQINLAERGTGVFNLSGSGAITAGTLSMVGYSNAGAGANGTFNLLSGGTLTVGTISFNYPGQTSFGTGTFNFNGGLLQPSGNNSSFFTGAGVTNVQQAANVDENGAIINTNGYSVTIGQALLHGGINPTDGGLTVYSSTGSGMLILTGANLYNGLTTVSSGTLQIGNGGASGTLGSGAVVNNSTLAFSRSDAALVVSNVISGSGGLYQLGSGATTLSASNTYTGPTNVSAGSLFVNGSLPSGGTVNVAAGAALGGTGSVGQTFVASGGGINVSANGTSALTLASLVFTGNASISLPSLTSTTSVAIQTGSLNPGGGRGSVQLDFPSTTVANGVYPLIGFSGSIGGLGLSAFTVAQPPALGARQTPTLQINNGQLQYSVVGFTPYWNGQQSDWQSTNAWTLNPGGTLTTFETGDNDVFDDTGSTGAFGTAVNINMGNVVPISVTFSNSASAYSISGSNGIAGPAFLTMNGGGSLTINNSNSYTGGTQINAGLLNINNPSAIGSGTLTISGGSLGNNSGGPVTLSTNNSQSWNADFTFNGPNNLNLGTGAVTLAASRTVTVNAGSLTVGGVISGVGTSLTLNGSGGLILGGANTYNSGTMVLGGTLTAANNSALSTGPVTLSPASGTAVLAFTSGAPSISSLANSGSGSSVIVLGNATSGSATSLTIGSNNSNSSFSGTIGDLSLVNSAATGAIVKTGTGTLTLAAANTYTGGTTLSNGTIIAGAPAALGTGALTLNGGTLQGAFTSSGGIPAMTNNIQINAVGGNALNAAGFDLPLSGNFSGAGTVTTIGSNNVYLGGSNAAFSGSYIQSAGNTFFNNSGGSAGSAAASWVINSGNLANVSAGTLTINLGALSGGGGTLGNNDASGGQVTYAIGGLNSATAYSGTIVDSIGLGGTTAIAQTGSGSLTLSGTNSYSGGTTITNGTLVPSNTSALGTGTITLNGGTLQGGYAGGSSTLALANNIQVNPVPGNALNAPSGNNLPLAGNLTGSGTLTKFGAYTVILSGSNAGFTGTYINTTSNTFFNGTAPGSAAASWVINGGSFANILTGTQSVSLGALSGTGGQLGNNIGSSLVTYSIGGLGANTTFSGSIVDSVGGGGTTAIIVAGGMFTPSGANSYSGGTTVSAGTIQLGNNSGLGASTGGLTVAGGALLDVNGFSPSVGALNGSGVIDNVTSGSASVLTIGNGGGSGAFSGTIKNTSGTLTLAVAGGTQVLSGTNTYSGGTQINGGVLNFVPSALPFTTNPPNISFGGGTLQWAASNTLDVSAGIAPIASGVSAGIDTNGNNVTFASSLSGSGGLTKAGAGTLTLAVANTFSGPTNITGGAVNVAHAAALQGSTANVAINNGLTFSVPAATLGGLSGSGNVNLGATALTVGANNNSSVYTGSLSGGNGLTKTGSGTLTLTGSSSYGGATNISGGVLQLTGVPVAPVTTGLLYQLDASNPANYTLNGANVATMLDISGNSNSFVGSGTNGPTILSGASGINGLSAMHFNGSQQLVLPNSTTPETVFIINRPTNNAGDAGILGQTGTVSTTQYDFGIRETGSSGWYYAGGNGNDYVTPSTGPMYINGIQVASNANGAYTLNVAQLLAASNPSPSSGVWTETGLAEYGTINAGNRYFAGDIGEVLAYSSTLSPAALQQVSAYLMNKWLGTVLPGYPASNLLPSTTPVTISNGGTFDMTNCVQTIASLTSTDGLGSQVLLGAGALTVGDSTSTTFDGTISGAGGSLIKQGSGSLTLTGAIVGGYPTSNSSFSGNITISGGTLVGAALSSGANSVFGAESNTRTITVNAGGTLQFDAPNTLGPAFDSTTAPTLNINGGVVTNADPLGSNAINNALNNVILTSGTLTATTGEHEPSGPGYAAWNINGTITSSGNSLISTTDPVFGTTMLSSANGNISTIDVTSGTLTVSAPLVQDDADNLVSGFNQTGAGLMILTASNTYSGSTTVSGGTLQVGAGGSGASIGMTSGVTLANGAAIVFDHADHVAFAPAITGNGSLTQTGPGVLTLQNSTNAYTGGTTINGGGIQLGGLDGQLPSLPSSAAGGLGGALTITAGTLDLNGQAQTIGALNGSASALITDTQSGGTAGSNGTTPLTVDFDSGSSNFAGTIADGPTAYISLTKEGAGTLILSGTNTYSGGTIVSEGTLQLNDSEALANGSSLTVGDASAFGALLPAAAGQPAASSPGITPVPEPGTLALLFVALCGAAFYRRRT